MKEMMITVTILREKTVPMSNFGDMDHETVGTAIEQCSTYEAPSGFISRWDEIKQRLIGVSMIVGGCVGAALDPQEGGLLINVLGGLGLSALLSKKQIIF